MNYNQKTLVKNIFPPHSLGEVRWRSIPIRVYALAVLLPSIIIAAAFMQPLVPIDTLFENPLTVAQQSESAFAAVKLSIRPTPWASAANAQAIPLAQNVLAAVETQFSSDNWIVGAPLNNLAGLYRKTGRIDETSALDMRWVR